MTATAHIIDARFLMIRMIVNYRIATQIGVGNDFKKKKYAPYCKWCGQALKDVEGE